MAQMDTALDAPAKKSPLPLIIGAVLMLLFGAGTFYTLYSGLLFGSGKPKEKVTESAAHPGITYVALDPLIISLGSKAPRHLRFSAQLEVPQAYQQEVESLKPRVADVLNSYLRAVDVGELENANALIRMRAQMLRRIQVVTGEGRVRDLLIIEFVLN
ncbi:flagellar basal body protein FliL [Sinirhodobacter populi]|uniref:Flagellar protein FliL n=1 Tax=Paenirhodobacter populi TaxID=2306993 RepID=A0A443KAZ7_9RHOB|nr:flagellar basal body-associated FliL family protein [Sinirhodobacter populi]RWR29915.1 flagellar basal body protein FliL [Sinirhodobacter populi]